MIRIGHNIGIADRNTFHMKVQTACLVEYDSIEDLKEIRSLLEDREQPDCLPVPVLHIGGGSNLLFTKDFPGTLLHSCIRFIRPLTSGKSSEVYVEVGAGTVFDDFCGWAADRGLWGTENLSHIPGETGAAAVQNIGAYGVEVKDVIDRVNCYDMVLDKTVSFGCGDCGYGYRDSIFKRDRKGRYVVTSVTFRLSSDPAPVLDYGHIRAAVLARGETLTPSLVRDVITCIRKDKLPDPSETGSAGSFFKNPVVPRSDYERVLSIAELYLGKGCNVPHYDMGSGFIKIPAAWLIEQCGWKGCREGNAGVYEKQPLVIINATGNASPEEILSLEDKIVASVRKKFWITLTPEVEHI